MGIDYDFPGYEGCLAEREKAKQELNNDEVPDQIEEVADSKATPEGKTGKKKRKLSSDEKPGDVETTAVAVQSEKKKKKRSKKEKKRRKSAPA